MWRSTEFRLSPGFLVTLGVSVLAGAGSVLPAVLGAAVCHEAGHLLALWAYHVPVESVTIGPVGAVIRASGQDRLSYGRDLTATLAGVAVNFALALLSSRAWGMYLFAGANAVLGLYNLLPIQGLDGGRALYLAAAWIAGPFAAQRLCHLVNLIALSLLLSLVAGLVWETGGGLLCLAAVLGMALSQLRPAAAGRRRARRGSRCGRNFRVAKPGKSGYNT